MSSDESEIVISRKRKTRRSREDEAHEQDDTDQPGSSRGGRGMAEGHSERKRKDTKGGKRRNRDDAVENEDVEEEDEERRHRRTRDTVEVDDDEGNGIRSMMKRREDASKRVIVEEEEDDDEVDFRGINLHDEGFVIPTRDEDLLVQLNGYYVEALKDEDQALLDVDEFEDEVMQGNWRDLRNRFDSFYSILRAKSDINANWSTRTRVLNCLLICFDVMREDLASTLGSVANGAGGKQMRVDCRELSDVLLMIIYLLYRCIVLFEKETVERERKKAEKKKPGRRGRKKTRENEELMSGDEDEEGDEEDLKWKQLRTKVIDVYSAVVNFQVVDKDRKTCEGAVKYLWRGFPLNKSMIRCLLDGSFKFFEVADITKHTSKPFLNQIFRLIRSMCTTFHLYQHVGSLLFEKIMSLDYFRETSTSFPFIEAIQTVNEKNEMDKLIVQMLVHFSTVQFIVTQNNSKVLSLFIISYAEREPYRLLQHIPSVLALLGADTENASIRSAVMQALSILLDSPILDPKVSPLSDRLMRTRKGLFQPLHWHVRDTNANVRATAIKCFTMLAQKRKVPQELLSQALVSLIGERLVDQKVAVRTAAVRFINTFLSNNPYGHDFNKRENVQKLKDLTKRRDRLRSNPTDQDHFGQSDNLFSAIAAKMRMELDTWAEKYEIGEFRLPTDEELSNIHAFVTSKIDEARKNGDRNAPDASSMEMDYLSIFAISLLIDVPSASHMIFCAAASDGVRSCRITPDRVEEENFRENVVEELVNVSSECFMEMTARVHNMSDLEALRAENAEERRQILEEQLNRDIRALVDKLIVGYEIAKCLPLVLSSVMQGEIGDVKQGMEFIIQCKEFGIENAEEAVRRLCGLVWKGDDESRTLVLNAARSMFLSQNPNNARREAATAFNLLLLVKSMKDNERSSVEEVLALATASSPIEIGVYHILWNGVGESFEEVNDPRERFERMANLKALSLLARSDTDRNRKWLRKYQKIVMTGWPALATEALGVIATLTHKYPSQGKENEKQNVDEVIYRIPSTDSLFSTIEQFVLRELLREESVTWNRSLRFVLSIYFDICKDTCIVTSKLVAKVMWYARRISQALAFYTEQCEIHEEGTKEGEVVRQRHTYLIRQWCMFTERLCTLAGELAVRFLVQADLVFVRELLRARDRMLNLHKPPRRLERPLRDWELKSALRKGVFDWVDSALTAEVTGLTEEERVRSRAATITDVRLLKHTRLLGRLLPLVVHCARAKGSPPRVKHAAVNAMAKFMLLNQGVASRGARTFFAFLNGAPSPVLRSNLVVCSADLTFRHPNLVERHATALFTQLADKNTYVRESCMLVLTHLIGNDLLKTHGILSYALRGYDDEETSIRHLARNLFTEWSKKDGVLSHVPDFISRLSHDSKEVPLHKFRTIMTNFLPLLKEKKDNNQIQSLIEKLCKRFDLAKNSHVIARNPDLPAYYSHCLSLLQLNTRSFRKLVDCLDHFKQFLGDQRVYADIQTLMGSFSKDDKSSNSDIAQEISTFNKTLSNYHERFYNELDTEHRVAAFQADHGMRAVAIQRRKVKKPMPSEVTPLKKGRGAVTSKSARKKRKVINSTDDDDDDDDSDFA